MNMSECGIIFNRHNWITIGRGEDFHLFETCSKCGETKETWMDGAAIRVRTLSYFEAKVRVRIANRNRDFEEQGRKQAIEDLKEYR
jgi:hypothetical protein